jgi:hypothetical protein
VDRQAEGFWNSGSRTKQFGNRYLRGFRNYSIKHIGPIISVALIVCVLSCWQEGGVIKGTCVRLRGQNSASRGVFRAFYVRGTVARSCRWLGLAILPRPEYLVAVTCGSRAACGPKFRSANKISVFKSIANSCLCTVVLYFNQIKWKCVSVIHIYVCFWDRPLRVSPTYVPACGTSLLFSKCPIVHILVEHAWYHGWHLHFRYC